MMAAPDLTIHSRGTKIVPILLPLTQALGVTNNHRNHMDKAAFWKLIDGSRRSSDGDPEAQIETLGELLSALEPVEIVAFDRILSEYHDRAYNWNLWGAAYIIGGGCSDDGFADFRGWLISRGEKAFENALLDPEILVKVVKEDDGECQIEGFQYIASQTWEQKTDLSAGEFPRHEFARHAEPTGEKWEEDDLETRFPKLCKKFE
jgi:hypothetical protein